MDDGMFPHHGEAERWLAVVGLEGSYEVSDLGRVRSVPRKDALGRRVHGGIRRPSVLRKTGHLKLGLSANGQDATRFVHQLVMEAFVGPCPEGHEVRHLDGNPANNRWMPGGESATRAAGGNLIYGTRSENVRDALRHGTHNYASRTHCDNGHEFTPENTAPRKGGGRICLVCRREHYAQQSTDRTPRGHRNARKTHCSKGHEFTEENTYRIPSRPTARYCRACIKANNEARKEQRRRTKAA